MKALRFADLLIVPTWHERANCNGLGTPDHDVMYPEQGGSVFQAKRVCARCEVRTECLEYALERREPYGVWGGKSERERRKLLRTDAPKAPSAGVRAA